MSVNGSDGRSEPRGLEEEGEGEPVNPGEGRTAERPKKRVKSAHQIAVLMKSFQEEPKPDSDSIKSLIQITGLSQGELTRWFRNQRNRQKSSSSSPQSHPEEVIDPVQAIDAGQLQNSIPKGSEADQERKEKKKNSDPEMKKLKGLVKDLSRSEKKALLSLLSSKGPNVGTSDPRLSRETKTERAREAWEGLERKFKVASKQPLAPEVDGANGDQKDAQLDPDMLEGLTLMFWNHRDYFFHTMRRLKMDEVLRPGIEDEMKKRLHSQLTRTLDAGRDGPEAKRSRKTTRRELEDEGEEQEGDEQEEGEEQEEEEETEVAVEEGVDEGMEVEEEEMAVGNRTRDDHFETLAMSLPYFAKTSALYQGESEGMEGRRGQREGGGEVQEEEQQVEDRDVTEEWMEKG